MLREKFMWIFEVNNKMQKTEKMHPPPPPPPPPLPQNNNKNQNPPKYTWNLNHTTMHQIWKYIHPQMRKRRTNLPTLLLTRTTNHHPQRHHHRTFITKYFVKRPTDIHIEVKSKTLTNIIRHFWPIDAVHSPPPIPPPQHPQTPPQHPQTPHTPPQHPQHL